MTNLIIHINQMFDNEDQNLDLNLHSQIPNQDLYLTPNQNIEVQEIPKKPQQLKRKKHYI